MITKWSNIPNPQASPWQQERNVSKLLPGCCSCSNSLRSNPEENSSGRLHGNRYPANWNLLPKTGAPGTVGNNNICTCRTDHTWCQFHQCFTSTFFVRKFVQSQSLSKDKTFVQKNARVKYWWNWLLVCSQWIR